MAIVTFHITAELADSTPAIVVDTLSQDLAAHVRQAIGIVRVLENWKVTSDELTIEDELREGRY